MRPGIIIFRRPFSKEVFDHANPVSVPWTIPRGLEQFNLLMDDTNEDGMRKARMIMVILI